MVDFLIGCMCVCLSIACLTWAADRFGLVRRPTRRRLYVVFAPFKIAEESKEKLRGNVAQWAAGSEPALVLDNGIELKVVE